MALVVKDRVKETTTTTGTGTLTLAGSSSGYQSFAAIGNGNSTYYVITDVTSGAWEVGIGTYTASGTTLSRDTVLSSSNSGSLVSFGAGVKDVFVAYPSERAVYLDSAGSYPVQSTFGTLTAATANLTNGTVSSTPSSGTDIANKTYVDTLVSSGITYHAPVRLESPSTAGNLNATYNNGTAGVGATLTNAGAQVALTIDGVATNTNDRVLIYNQTNAYENGIYTVTDVGSGSTNWVLTRATDADSYGLKDTNALGEGDAFFVQSGDTGAGETYVCNTVGTITFGTTAITFAQVSSAQIYSAGTGLTLTGTQFSITNTGTAGTYGSASAVPVLTTNAQGQVTGVTNTTIAIAGSQVSGAISGQAGSVANSLTLGTYLTGGSYNGSSPITATVDATSANTASKVVARDASGNFSAGTITAALSGNATTATTSTNLAGGAANQISYQSGAGTTAFATAPSASGQVLRWNGSAFDWVAGTISGASLGSNLSTLTLGSYLTGTSYNGSAGVTAAVDATSANTASKVVARDASGNFSAGTITASLSGNATTATTATNVSGGTASVQTLSIASNPVGTTSDIALTANAATNSENSWSFGLTDSAGYYRWLLGNTSRTGGTAGGTEYARLTASSFNHTGNITVNGNSVLTTSNYNSYAPTLTGTGASGTWGISITGNASTVTNGVYTNATQTISGVTTYTGGLVASDASADGTIPTLTKFGRDTTQYTSFYGNASGNRMISVSSSGNPKEFQLRVTDSVTTGTFTFYRSGNLTGTGTVDFSKFLGNAADTAAAPSFSWTGDTNTGIYSPGADQVGISTGGTSQLTVDTSAVTSQLNTVVPRLTVSGSDGYLTSTSGVESWQYINNVSVASYATSPKGIFFSSDGLNLYIANTSNYRVYQYSLSSAWDVSTATYLRSLYTATNSSYYNWGLYFSPDGTKLYVTDNYNARVNRWNLSTAWNISTASYVNYYYYYSLEYSVTGIYFKDDGTKMYLLGATYRGIRELALSTAWDLSTASYSGNYYDLTSYANNVSSLSFSPDGLKFWVLEDIYGRVSEFTLSTAWSITTASFNSVINISSSPYPTALVNPGGLYVEPSQDRAYVSDYSVTRVFGYSTDVNATKFQGYSFSIESDTQIKNNLTVYQFTRFLNTVYGVNFYGNVYNASSPTQTLSIGSTTTSGTINIASALAGGTVSIGNSGSSGYVYLNPSQYSSTTYIATGYTYSGYTKNINIGTNGYSGSTTNIYLGSGSSNTITQFYGAIAEEVYTLSGTALDPRNGTIQTKTLSANTTFTDAFGSGQSITLMLQGGSSYTVTWPTMTWYTVAGNVAPTLTTADTLVLWKVSTTLYGAYVGSGA